MKSFHACRALLVLLFLTASTVFAEPPKATELVPTHPRLLFRKDDLAAIRKRCLATHAAEYAVLKASADRSAALGTQPVAPGLVWQLTGESRFLAWAESDYDAFHETLDPAVARRLADDILYEHRRRMSAVDGRPAIGDIRYMTVFGNRDGVLTICGDDVPLAGEGELTQRLRVLARAFREARMTYEAIARRRGGKNTTFHCACFFDDVPEFYEKWRIATGENHFRDTLMTGLILQAAHSTLPLDHAMAAMTNSWGHDHLGRPAEYLLASRARDGLCQWVMHNPAWVTARNVGTHDPRDFNALGRAWAAAVKDLGGYKEASWTTPVAWWPGHMPERILWYDPGVNEVPIQSLPTAALFEGLGMACMRSGWGDDAVFARLHSGPNFRGEPPHLNDNTFVIYHKGMLVKPEPSKGVLTQEANSVLVKDPDEKIFITGTCGGLWPDTLWDGVEGEVRATEENDGGQSYWRAYVGHLNTAARGRISAWQDAGLFTYAVGDATMSYNPAKLSQFTRQFLFVKPGLFLVFDRVVSTRPEFEKRWVLHTKAEPVALDEEGRAFRVDAFEHVRGTRGWERTVGFDMPVNEKGPPAKTTLKFGAPFDGVEVCMVHRAGPEFGKVSWRLDGGEQQGVIDQRADAEAPRVETVVLKNVAKGEHALELTWPEAKVNYTYFIARFGGRLFVSTLLPAKTKREVTPNANAQKDPFGMGTDWRTDVVATEPRTDDVFLHVLEATDRAQAEPVAVETTEFDDRIVLDFAYRDRRCQVTFNRVGLVGGRVRVMNADGVRLDDRALAPGIVDEDDAHILRCRREIDARALYDYDVNEIANLMPTAPRDDLVKALEDKRWYVRFYAVRALAAKGDQAASGEIARRLGDDDPRVAAAAAEALGRLGAKDSEPALVGALDAEADEVRFYAAWSLGELRLKNAVDPLIRRLGDANEFVGVSAVEALAKIGDARAVAPLIAQVDRWEKPHLRSSCLLALGRLDHPDAMKKLEAFRDIEDATLRACAVAGIARRAGGDAMPLLKTLKDDKESDLRAFAARKLAELGDAATLDELLATARNVEGAFAARVDALDLLGRLKHAPAADAIAALLAEDEQADARKKTVISPHAALALYRMGDARGVAFLEQAVMNGADKDRTSVSKTAAKLLASVDADTAVPILAKALEVRKTQIAGEAVQSLYQLTHRDPGGDIEIVGWRRVGLDAQRWKDWWQAEQAKKN